MNDALAYLASLERFELEGVREALLRSEDPLAPAALKLVHAEVAQRDRARRTDIITVRQTRR